MSGLLAGLYPGAVMERPFDDIHAGADSQLRGGDHGVPDSSAVRTARAAGDNYDAQLALGRALSRQLRYREAADAYSRALALRPGDLTALRLRAGRYLTTLRSNQAAADFRRCLALGGESVDCGYRLGLSLYFGGQYREAMDTFQLYLPLCGDEMGVALLYWHTLAADRLGDTPSLLDRWRPGMDVGHHTAYERALRLWAGAEDEETQLLQLSREPDDLEYAIWGYGVYRYLRHAGDARSQELLTELLARDGFWPCFSYLAAWQDRENGL